MTGPKKGRHIDYLRVYPGLNDFGDALEAIPIETARHLTHLKEIEAKCGDALPSLAKQIREFLRPSQQTPKENKSAIDAIRTTLIDVMPCLEEKMQVANLAAEEMYRQTSRLDLDFEVIRMHEIPAAIQIDPDDPALSEIKLPTVQASTGRSGARREAIAAKKAAAAAAASAADSSRAATPVSRTRGRGRNATPTPAAVAVVAAAAAVESLTNGADSYDTKTVFPPASEPPALIPDAEERRFGGMKRRRDSDEPLEEPTSRRRRNPNEPTYCYCNQGSYGDMVACDGPECKREWFHLGCIGLSAPPKGQWFCRECQDAFRRK